VSYEYDGLGFFVLFVSIVDQTAKHILSMVHNVCCRIAQCCSGIIFEIEDPGLWNIGWREVFGPERFGIGAGPGINRISIETVDEDNARVRKKLAS
jgi:hypothetical protein